MIKNLNIENFRCFRKTKIKGFSDINLIGGQNNAGKTALLEAIFINLSPRANTILSLRRTRRESLEFAKNLPERAWSNLFFNLNLDEALKIISYDQNGDEYNNIEILCNESPDMFNKIFEEDDQVNDDLVDLRTLLSERKYTRSTLNISLIKNGSRQSLYSLVAHSKGIIRRDLNMPDDKKVNYIPASLRLTNEALAREYDKADMKGHSEHLLEAMQITDPLIKEVKTFNIGESAVYLKKLGGEYLSIYLYGEAITKTTELILRMINDRNSVLLIDEVENGIHHTNQYELWKMIFKLSSAFNIQIFATTHSHEMIQAFVKAGLSDEKFKRKAAYVEMAENVKSGDLIGIKRDLETLEYEARQGMGFRGE